MRKNKMMRAASGLLVATLLTTSAISGTFAKYTTTSTGTDTARVAKWGFNNDDSSIKLDDLFKNAYDKNVKGEAEVIAPGTTNSATFKFNYSGTQAAPEVAYTFNVSTANSSCADAIKKNNNIQWRLDNGTWGTWDELLAAIQNLDGTEGDKGKEYKAGELPKGFDKTTTHTVEWQWLFEDTSTGATAESIKAQDAKDTAMGNKETLDEVTLNITITATQID